MGCALGLTKSHLRSHQSLCLGSEGIQQSTIGDTQAQMCLQVFQKGLEGWRTSPFRERSTSSVTGRTHGMGL